jgi:hypothetical protein
MDGNTSQRGFSCAGLASRLLLENLKESSTKEGRRKVQRLLLKHMRNINRRPLKYVTISKNYLRQVISKWKENSSKKEKYLITMTRKTYRCLNMVAGRVGTKLIMLKK